MTVERNFLRYFAAGLLGCAVLFFAVTLVIDPYGVSPLRVTSDGVNKLKPRRVNLDRSIKPYEVWRRAPRTVFLGTSRIHQSMDPSVLETTRFSPAYNASIPASTPLMNAAHLRQYIRLNPNIKTVFVELFFYNFARQVTSAEPPAQTLGDYVRNMASLFASLNTLWDSAVTVAYNVRGKPVHEVKAGGHFFYPPGHDATGTFGSYPAGIWTYHEARRGRFEFYDPGFQAVREFAEISRLHGLELIFILTPNHAYDDYYLEAVGGWDAVEQWLARVTANATVYSFSQPNGWVYEPVARGMRYWNDPYHFSLEMGRAMQLALAGRDVPGAPPNFMQRITPQTVHAHVTQRRQAIREWAKANPDFVARFNHERRKWELSRAGRTEPGGARGAGG
jgi:hypothetical protein